MYYVCVCCFVCVIVSLLFSFFCTVVFVFVCALLFGVCLLVCFCGLAFVICLGFDDFLFVIYWSMLSCLSMISHALLLFLDM